VRLKRSRAALFALAVLLLSSSLPGRSRLALDPDGADDFLSGDVGRDRVPDARCSSSGLGFRVTGSPTCPRSGAWRATRRAAPGSAPEIRDASTLDAGESPARLGDRILGGHVDRRGRQDNVYAGPRRAESSIASRARRHVPLFRDRGAVGLDARRGKERRAYAAPGAADASTASPRRGRAKSLRHARPERARARLGKTGRFSRDFLEGPSCASISKAEPRA